MKIKPIGKIVSPGTISTFIDYKEQAQEKNEGGSHRNEQIDGEEGEA